MDVQTLAALANLYLLRCEVEGKSPGTVRAYRETVTRFLRQLPADVTDPTDVQADHICVSVPSRSTASRRDTATFERCAASSTGWSSSTTWNAVRSRRPGGHADKHPLGSRRGLRYFWTQTTLAPATTPSRVNGMLRRLDLEAAEGASQLRVANLQSTALAALRVVPGEPVLDIIDGGL